jgi:hypothetical protein
MTTQTVVIHATKEAIEAIRNAIAAQPATDVQVTERKNLDGSTAGWFLISNLAVSALPSLLGFIQNLVGMRQVKRIKIGDVEIDNPAPEDMERFRALLDARLRSLEKTNG